MRHPLRCRLAPIAPCLEDARSGADTLPALADTDGDGLDDAFDPDCDDDVCGVVGTPAPRPDLDMDERPDFQDPDDDGDGMTTATEIQDAMDYAGPAADPTDVRMDGPTGSTPTPTATSSPT